MARLLKCEYIADEGGNYTNPLTLREGVILPEREQGIESLDRRQLHQFIGSEYELVMSGVEKIAQRQLDSGHFPEGVTHRYHRKRDLDFIWGSVTRGACFAVLDSVGTSALESPSSQSVLTQSDVLEQVMDRTGDPALIYRNLGLNVASEFEPIMGTVVEVFFRSKDLEDGRLLFSTPKSWVARYDDTPETLRTTHSAAQFVFRATLLDQ